MTVNNTDTFLVERSGTSYKLQAQNLMADLQDTDLMLVERSGTSYKATGLDIKNSLGSDEPTFKATASGAISTGRPVVKNSNGTVSQVSSVVTNHSVGSQQTIQSSLPIWNGHWFDACEIGSNKLLFIYYHSNSYKTYARIGTISGSSLSYGTEVTVDTNGYGEHGVSAVIDNNNRLALVAGSHVQVATFSGTTITFVGSLAETYTSNYRASVRAAHSPHDNKIYVWQYWTFGPGYEMVNTWELSSSGVTNREPYNLISTTGNQRFYKDAVYCSSKTGFLTTFVMPNDVYVQFIKSDSSSSSGPTESNVIQRSSVFDGAITWHPTLDVGIVVYSSNSNTYIRHITVNTTNNTVSWGNEITLFSSNTRHRFHKIRYDSATDNLIYVFCDPSNNYRPSMVTIEATLSGNTLSVTKSTTYQTDSTNGSANDVKNWLIPAYSGKVLQVYRQINSVTSITGNIVTLPNEVTNLTETNYIGISDGSFSNGQEAKTITHLGTATTYSSSLSSGTTYYVQQNGNLDTTPYSRASVKAGVASSSSAIDIDFGQAD